MSYPLCYTVRMKIDIRATAKATKHTKERIAQHGPTFKVESKAIDAREDSWLMVAPDGWWGWVRLEEFEII